MTNYGRILTGKSAALILLLLLCPLKVTVRLLLWFYLGRIKLAAADYNKISVTRRTPEQQFLPALCQPWHIPGLLLRREGDF